MAEAHRAGLKAIAVTDHDTTAGSALIDGSEPVEAIPGIEISVFDHPLGYEDVHVIGLYIDPKDPDLNARMAGLGREDQKRATVEALNSLGYSITFQDVKAKSEGVVGRPHIAMALMERYPDEFPTMSSVFDKLIGRGKPAYVGRESGIALAEAVDLIHGAGGLAFLCHLFIYPYDPSKLVRDFKAVGGDGLEVYYDYCANMQTRQVSADENERMIEKGLDLASGSSLLTSGGSDFHGPGKKGHQRLGEFYADDPVLVRIKEALHSRRAMMSRLP
jgi:predicted metal-dependent phosphoesterase TrpH